MFWLELIELSDEFGIQNRKSKIQNGYDSTERAGAGGQGDKVKEGNRH
jgi:hypothetical protein